MKCFILAIFVLQTAVAALPDSLRLEAETNHSTVMFSVPISNGLTRITGKFNDYKIDLHLIDDDLLKSKIVATIQITSIDTGIPARDSDLLASTFFEADKYPVARFESKSIVRRKKFFVAIGTLEMHGQSREIELPFTLTGRKDNGVIGFRCRTKIKRSDFGVGTAFKHTTDDKFIGDEVAIEIDFWTRKPRLKPKA